MSPSGRHRTPATEAATAAPTEVIPRVYVADLAAAENATVLAHLGITHVLSAMPGTVAVPPIPTLLQSLQLPLHDSPFAELAEHLPRATAFIADALADPQARVLVHCVQGVSRSASVVCAYLIRAYGWTPAQAVQYVKSKRPAAEPNPGFITQLGEYAELLQREQRQQQAGANASTGQRRR
jgi:protein-tyrosine phosphatase